MILIRQNEKRIDQYQDRGRDQEDPKDREVRKKCGMYLALYKEDYQNHREDHLVLVVDHRDDHGHHVVVNQDLEEGNQESQEGKRKDESVKGAESNQNASV